MLCSVPGPVKIGTPESEFRSSQVPGTSNSNSFIHVPITIFTSVKVYIYILIMDTKETRKKLC